NAILNNCNTIPLQLPPVTRKPLKIGGVLHGTNATVLGTRPVARAIEEIIVNKTGITINGINIIGFNTIGNPNITGSLILKILPDAETLAISRYACFICRHIT